MTLSALLSTLALAAPYSTGERMAFSIDYLGMRVGTAAITVGPPGERGVPVQLEAHTTGIVRAVHDFRESLVSWLDPATGLPTYFELHIHENRYVHYDTIEFDRAAGQAIVVERGKTTSTNSVAVPADALDFIALVFQLRRVPLEPGTRRSFSIVTGKEGSHEVIAEAMGRETMKTSAGTFPVLKIRVPTGFTGKFSERNPTYVWLSDDPRRVVVKISTDFSFGSAAANLVKYTPGEASGDGAAAR